MPKMLRRKRAIAAAVEASEGVAESLVAGDSTFDVYDPTFKPDVPVFRRTFARSSLSPKQGLPGSQMGTISFGVELKGSGTAATVPGFDKLLRACGFKQIDPWHLEGTWTGAFVAGERITQATSGAIGIVMFNASASEDMYLLPVSGTFDTSNLCTGSDSGATGTPTTAEQAVAVGYQPDSDLTVIPSLTIGGYFDGIRHVIRGARGSVSFVGTRDEVMRANFEFQGVYDTTTDVALVAASPDATVPPVFLGVDLRLPGDYAAIFEALTIDMQTEVALRSDAGDPAGYLSALVVGREPQMTVDPEMETVANHDFYGRLKAGTPGEIEFELGSVAGNRFRFGAPLVQYSDLSDDDRNSVATAGLTCHLSGKDDGGDDELVILHY